MLTELCGSRGPLRSAHSEEGSPEPFPSSIDVFPTSQDDPGSFPGCYILHHSSAFSAGIMSLSGNSLLLLVAYRKRSMLKPAEFFIVNLAISDLSMTVTLFPLATSSFFAHRYLVEVALCWPTAPDVVCKPCPEMGRVWRDLCQVCRGTQGVILVVLGHCVTSQTSIPQQGALLFPVAPVYHTDLL